MLGAKPDRTTGKRRLLLPSNEFVHVEDGLSDAEIMARYGLDELREAPEVRVCTAVYLDGPLAGQTNPYSPTELGEHTSYTTAAVDGRTTHTYELVELPDGDEPGRLRFVSSRVRSSS